MPISRFLFNCNRSGWCCTRSDRRAIWHCQQLGPVFANGDRAHECAAPGKAIYQVLSTSRAIAWRPTP
jgi:hypothetical protein